MIYYVTAYAYMAFLALGALVALRGSFAMKRAMFTVAANYAAAFCYTWVSKDPTPWPLFMALDFVSAAIILIKPAGRAQALVGLIYLMQISIHTGYAIALPNADGVVYWWLLTALAFLQLAVIGGWMLYDRGYRLPRAYAVWSVFSPSNKQGNGA